MTRMKGFAWNFYQVFVDPVQKAMNKMWKKAIDKVKKVYPCSSVNPCHPCSKILTKKDVYTR